MSIGYFDIETNAINDWSTLSDIRVCHCMVIIDEDDNVYRYRSATMLEGMKHLLSFSAIVGHNAIGFDYPALNSFYGFKHPNVLDTAVMTRCMFPDLFAYDAVRGTEKGIRGKHSLEAWGKRIGCYKSTHGKTEDWSKWSQDMEDYCVQDVKVTKALHEFLLAHKPSQRMLDLEHEFALCMRRQQWIGFPFDDAKAEELEKTLCVRRRELGDELEQLFEPTVLTMKSRFWVTTDGKEFSTKKEALESGYSASDITEGDHKTKTIPFNPCSRDQIAERLMARGWKPTAYEGKRPQINEKTLKDIGTPEALLLLEYLLVSKRLGQLSEGKHAWRKLVVNGRIHGSVITNGAVSGRCTHRNPNMAQVPSTRAPYGKECRALFTAPEGKVLVGADASQLELRCLAHYLTPFDNGAYTKELLEGDIHSANQVAAGLPTRDDAKTFIYAFLYGAGDSKIGAIVGGSAKDGKRLKRSFLEKIPAMGSLTEAVARRVEENATLTGLDGRILPCRSAHSALNLLLQSAGAVIMKQALVFFCRVAEGYELHANVHDEAQFSCDAKDADELGQLFVDSIAKAGEHLNFCCPLDGEYNIGQNWKDTH